MRAVGGDSAAPGRSVGGMTVRPHENLESVREMLDLVVGTLDEESPPEDAAGVGGCAGAPGLVAAIRDGLTETGARPVERLDSPALLSRLRSALELMEH